MSPLPEKAALRQAVAAARAAAFAAGQGAAAAGHLSALLAGFGGRVLAGYMPMRSELDPLPVMAGHDGPVCVPVVVGKGLPLVFHRWTPEAAMVEGRFGALVPAVGEPLVPEVLIVPLLAWDRRGYRLGYGGGFYDRTLEGLRAQGQVTAIGFGFAAQEVAEVPTDATDQRLDMMVTERGREF